jgi:hypothetical protein
MGWRERNTTEADQGQQPETDYMVISWSYLLVRFTGAGRLVRIELSVIPGSCVIASGQFAHCIRDDALVPNDHVRGEIDQLLAHAMVAPHELITSIALPNDWVTVSWKRTGDALSFSPSNG